MMGMMMMMLMLKSRLHDRIRSIICPVCLYFEGAPPGELMKGFEE